ncbi:MAG: hypothetical protein COV71_03785 [Candidatus Omnitrophica bacterium CG11_big_fil_rev_8_21_14_0_20_41_12]|nr:MAG: hypothetical protein COV71_03785 [Candidatus Omnitrophica bacterium CG11_big_fil_rev_8_21_14_0_20_41_12]
MSYKKVVILAGFIILSIVTTLTVFAEEPIAAPEQNINQTQWAWGEVTALDAQGKTITLKYLDYETDQEKDLVLAVDEKTNFENIGSFDEIKVKDTLSIDYVAGVDGRSVAKNINFEKPSSSATAAVPVAEDNKMTEAAEQPVADISAQEVVPVETLAPVKAAVTETVQSTVESGTVSESSVLVNEAPVQPEPTPMPEIQSEDQVQ